jgi:hypothetical protein
MRVPLHWAMTQNNLGTVLRALGERESETLRLEEAIAAYEAALTVFGCWGAMEQKTGLSGVLLRCSPTP